MASELEQARQNVQGAWAASRERQDVVMDLLEEAVRRDERVAVVARIRAREWGLFVRSSTVDRITDFILEDDSGK